MFKACLVVFSMLISFPVAVRKPFGKSNLREKWLLLGPNPRVQSSLAGRLMWQELGTAAPIISTVRQLRTQNAQVVCLLSSLSPFMQSNIPPREWCRPWWTDGLTSVWWRWAPINTAMSSWLLTLTFTVGICIYCDIMITLMVVYLCTTPQGFVVFNFVLKSQCSLLAKFKYVFQHYSVGIAMIFIKTLEIVVS